MMSKFRKKTVSVDTASRFHRSWTVIVSVYQSGSILDWIPAA